MRLANLFLTAATALFAGAGAAFAFSDEPAPSGPAVQSQFSDPDEAVENLANGASGGGSGTEISNGAQIPSNGAARPPAPASPLDAEPVNPHWPAWMVWHQN